MKISTVCALLSLCSSVVEAKWSIIGAGLAFKDKNYAAKLNAATDPASLQAVMKELSANADLWKQDCIASANGDYDPEDVCHDSNVKSVLGLDKVLKGAAYTKPACKTDPAFCKRFGY